MRKNLSLFLMLIIFVMPVLTFADSYKTYNASYAVNYATNNYDRPYSSGSGSNLFYNYDNLYGGNCTNFASQCIMAGLVRSNSVTTVYNNRYEYDCDKGGDYNMSWYFRSDSDRGPAFTGADKLYEYAVNNQSSYKGLHFQYVTHDTPNNFMNYSSIQVGDIVFADWNNDGAIDHSMVVTAIKWWKRGYDKVRVTYQGTPGVVGKNDIGLGYINEENNYNAMFYVYRPLNYNPSGL